VGFAGSLTSIHVSLAVSAVVFVGVCIALHSLARQPHSVMPR
jgi:hypothetical protein